MGLHQISSTFLWLVVGFVCLGAGVVQAEGSFRDEFVNPDPTNPDREPVTWVSDWDSEVLIQNEDLVIADTAGIGLDNVATAEVPADDFFAADAVVETQFRIIQGTNAGIMLRYAPGGQCYFGDVATSNFVRLQAVIGRCDTSDRISDIATIDVDALQEDVVMRLQAVGDQLSFWVWSADEMQPEVPTVTVRDSLYSDGRVGVYVDDVVTNGATQAAFRYFEAVVIPEPSTAVLSVLGLLGLLAWRRKHRP